MLLGLGRSVPAATGPAPPTAAAFRTFLDGLWPEAERAGVTRATFDAAVAGLEPDAAVAAMTRHQPEFTKPMGVYLAAQVTAARVAAGQAELARWTLDLADIEARYAVPRSIIVAVWGMETGYGTASAGSKDVIRSMATLAAMDIRPDLYRAELIAAFRMIETGALARSDLRGSWAGAMGLPQFMPSSFEKYAVDQDHDGRRNIWTSVPDALASIANFLHAQGWRAQQPWGCEVRVPAGFDDRVSRASLKEWAALGFTRADGRALPSTGEGILFYPAGSAGPAFLVTENFEVIKTYNFSDAYVLSVATLADRMDGGSPILGAWPTEVPMSRDDRIALQSRLVALGYAVDNRQGRISLALRDVIRAAETRVGLVPDGNPTTRLLRALQKVAADR